MNFKQLIFLVLSLWLSATLSNAAAYTATQSGNWSEAATWGGGGTPGDGDTATIGAYTVTVDQNTTVGTSPNDTTTKVVDKTSSTGALVVGAGVTFTVKGNIGGVNASTFTMQAGSTLTFDNSGSAGSPVYKFINVGFQKFNFNGTSGTEVTVQAIAGQTASLYVPTSELSATFTNFTRLSTLWKENSMAGPISITDCAFDTCGQLLITSTSTTVSCTIQRNTFTSGSHSTSDVNLAVSGSFSSGTRIFSHNVLEQALTYNSVGVECYANYFGEGVLGVSGRYYGTFRHNFINSTEAANGYLIQSPKLERNYFFSDKNVGNPHFLEARATTADVSIEQNIFESAEPDLIDYGDAILVVGSGISAGRKVTGFHNIVLRNASEGVSSGTLLTLYNADANAVTEWYHNTVNVDAGLTGLRAAIATAEANTGTAGQVAVLKSNLVWGSTSGQGYIGERLHASGVDDIITASGADYNWRYNTSDGDNQRGYEDQGGSGDLWTAGDAVAAGVDDNGGSGNPQFTDNTRNLATWTSTRGYGSTNADGLTAVQADPSRTADLINWVFGGFTVQNSDMRTDGHDGAPQGAANYNAGRTTDQILSKITAIEATYTTSFDSAL